MKKLFLTLAVALSALTASAQTVFAPAGAEWWYEQFSIGGPGYVRAFVAGSMNYQGTPCAVVRLDQWNGYPTGPGQVQWQHAGLTNDTLLFATAGDVVLGARKGEPLTPLLDFSRPVGSATRMQVPTDCPNWAGEEVDLAIDSLYTLTRQGVALRVQAMGAHSLSPAQSGAYYVFQTYIGPVTERLGFPNTLFFPWMICGTDVDTYRLVSYADTQLTYGTRPTIVLATVADLPETALTVAPNPSATGRFQLTGTALTYTVFDALGRRVQTGATAPAATELDLSARPAGLYVLRATDAAGRGLTRRLVRE